MKLKLIYLSFLSLFFVSAFYSKTYYEKTQTFTKHYKQLEDSIKNAVSLDELNSLSGKIDNLKNTYSSDKALLDKALYPDNFTSYFDKIEKALELRRGDFTQISELTTQVGSLQSQVDDLNRQNQSLISQIKELNTKSEKDAATISSLQKLVGQLRNNIQQRDELVRDLVDSLLAEFIKTPTGINETERKSLASKVDSRNLFYNIERTVADNIQFIKVTRMTPQDLADMKKQYNDFNKAWRQIGTKLGAVYLNKKEKVSEIANIDSMFSEWNMKINDEIWGQINKLFAEQNISLLPFDNSDQFVNSAETFIKDEIKNFGVKSKSESEKTFHAFTDSVYFKTVEPKWVPILIANKMMSEANKDTVEVRIAKWKATVVPSTGINWIYIALIAIIVLLIIILFARPKKKKIEPQENEQ